MYNDKIVIEAKNKKQVEVYKEFIKGIEEIKSIIESFNNKVVNVKLEKAINEALTIENLRVTLRNKTYKEGKEIGLYNGNRHLNHPLKEYGTIYVETSDIDINVVLYDDTNRLDAYKTIDGLNNWVGRLNGYIKDIEDTLKNYDTMIKDYEKIEELAKAFKEKYNYSIRNEAYCDFKRL